MSLNAGVPCLRLIPIDSREKMLSELMAGVTLVDSLLATSGVSYQWNLTFFTYYQYIRNGRFRGSKDFSSFSECDG